MKLLIGVPMLTPSFDFFVSWNKFWTELIRQKDFKVTCKFTHRQPAYLAQEKFIKLAIETNCTHVLLMDDDK